MKTLVAIIFLCFTTGAFGGELSQTFSDRGAESREEAYRIDLAKKNEAFRRDAAVVVAKTQSTIVSGPEIEEFGDGTLIHVYYKMSNGQVCKTDIRTNQSAWGWGNYTDVTCK